MRGLWLVVMVVGCAGTTGTTPGPSDAAVTDAALVLDAGSTEDAAVPLTVRTLVTLGSSSTAGAGASREATRYVNLVATQLGARLVNLGSGGQTVTQVQSTYLPRALEALDAGPRPPNVVDVVTFLPFTDFDRLDANALANGYDTVLQQLDPTGAFVVFGVPTIDERYACGSRGDLRGPDGECYDPALVDDYAEKGDAVRTMLQGHPLASAADIPQQQAQHPDWQQPDGHPNDLGHQDIARHFLVAIRARRGASQ
ncbi:MAG: SGNH/GDSL hydrolase family protein [Myxococcota bacterium]